MRSLLGAIDEQGREVMAVEENSSYEAPTVYEIGGFVAATLGGNGSQGDTVSYENGTSFDEEFDL